MKLREDIYIYLIRSAPAAAAAAIQDVIGPYFMLASTSWKVAGTIHIIARHHPPPPPYAYE